MKIVPVTKSVAAPKEVVEKNLNETNKREILRLHKRLKSSQSDQKDLFRFLLSVSIVARSGDGGTLVEQYTAEYKRGDLASRSKKSDTAEIKQETFENFFTEGYKFTGSEDDKLGVGFCLADMNVNLTEINLKIKAVVWTKLGLTKPIDSDFVVLSEGAEDNEGAVNEAAPSSSSSSSSAKQVVSRKKELPRIKLPWRARGNDASGNKMPDGVEVYPEYVLQPTVVSASVRSIVQPTHALLVTSSAT